jgi:glycosyltransferase involved in cell wall biosynthesis
LVYRALSSSCVAVSSSARDTCRPHTAEIIPNPVVAPELFSLSPTTTALRLLYLGKKDRVKGVDRLPGLLSCISDAAERVVLSCVGPQDASRGRELEDVRSQLVGLGLDVRWLGPSPADEHLPHTDVLLLPSRADSRPRVVEEALIRGIPVVHAPGLKGMQDIGSSLVANEGLFEAALRPQAWRDAILAAWDLRRRGDGRPLIREVPLHEVVALWRNTLNRAVGTSTS